LKNAEAVEKRNADHSSTKREVEYFNLPLLQTEIQELGLFKGN